MPTPQWHKDLIEKNKKGEITTQELIEAVKQHKLLEKGMIDPAQAGTDKILAEIEKKTHDAYQLAVKEMTEKVEKRLKKFDEMLTSQRELVDKGVISLQDYAAWMSRQSAMQAELNALAEVLAKDMHQANLIAAKIANGSMADVYALNANYAMYTIDAQWSDYFKGEANLGFSLYNHETAEILLREEQKSLLPAPSKKKLKELKKLQKTNPDILWNTEKMQSAILQSVLQGEGSTAIAKRIAKVGQMNEHQAIRNARTMTTNVQNMGRSRAYLNAKDMGIKLTIQWYAMLDGVTRHSHRLMHGQTKKNLKTAKFSNGCRWPGDPEGPAAEVYNCRCTTVAWTEGMEPDVPENSAWLDQNGMTFDEWQNMKAPSASQTAAAPAAQAAAPAPNPFKDAIANAQEYSPRWHETENFSDDFWRSLTENERNGVYTYTGSSYEDMNDYLRGRTTSISSRYKELINGCTEALNKHEIVKDTKLYRGMGSTRSLGRALGLGNDATADDIAKMVNSRSIIGRSFIEKGFCSTGVTSSAGWNKDVVMEIVAPKGTKGLYVDPISRHRGEREMLLQRGTIFQIYNAEYMSNGTLKLSVIATGTEPIKPV